LKIFLLKLYADTANDPFSGGRQMNCHFATPVIDKNGNWLPQDNRYNVSADISSTGGQMARAVGIAQASTWYRHHAELGRQMQMSQDGNEVCFVTIGDASTSEGVFWEAINAAAVIKAPMAVSVWDDGYGISVPTALQTTKQSISRLLEGFHIDENGEGIYLYTAKAWDYPGLCEMYERGIQKVRKNHLPAVFHIQEVTQPMGHSTSGSHERYKTPERLKWETDNDCIVKMGEWMVDAGIVSQKRLDEIRQNAIQYARECKQKAWEAFILPVRERKQQLLALFHALPDEVQQAEAMSHMAGELNSPLEVLFGEVLAMASKLKFVLAASFEIVNDDLENLISSWKKEGRHAFNTHLYASGKGSALEVPIVPAHFSETADVVTGVPGS
jgi:TPP-dependent pyruvate/acetoin dehydrogenase alpha subunit